MSGARVWLALEHTIRADADPSDADLPNPTISFLTHLQSAGASNGSSAQATSQQRVDPKQAPSGSPGKSRRLRKDSLENIDADPWASPIMHKGHTHDVQNEATPQDATTAARPISNGPPGPNRTTSTFTTSADDPASSGSTTVPVDSPGEPQDEGAGGWGTLGGDMPTSSDPGLGGGFGSGGDRGQPQGSNSSRALGGGRRNPGGVQETVTITLLPEKEGLFMFQHHNYEVKSVRRNSLVVRRYSDFVWLLNCLHKRYPFRQLPLLPPKTIAGESLSLNHCVSRS